MPEQRDTMRETFAAKMDNGGMNVPFKKAIIL
jgi:hypothetical protein